MSNRGLRAAGGCLILSIVAACATVDSDSPSAEASSPSASANLAEPRTTTTPPAPASVTATSQESGTDLLKQKKALLVETALRNAQALRDQGEYEGARRQLEEAMKHDPANADVTAQYLEILELLGERVGEIGTVRRVAEERSKVRREALRAEAEEYHRLATEAMERGDFDESIRYFERVQDSIRWSSLGVEWGDLPARNEASLEEATSARDSATEEQRQDKLREAFDRIREDERQQAQQRADQVATLLEKAASKYERGEFDSAIELCDQALLAESSNKTALDLRDESIDARRKGRQAQHREERAEAYRQFMRRIDELRIPYSDSLTPAPEDYWNQVLRRTSTTELNLDAVQSPEDQRLRELVKTTRVPEIHFEDDEIGTVTTVLQNITGIPMIATNELITDLDSSGELVSLPTLTNLSVASILDIIATTLGEDYSWTVRHGVVMFTTKEDAYGDTVIRTHPIQDLTFPLTNFKGPQIDKISLQGQYGDDPETSVFASDLEGEVIINPEDIVNLIRENVARESWDLEDKFSIDVAASNQILVIHTPQVHAEIAAFLDDLRRFSSTVVEIESRFIEITDAFIQEIGADFRGLGGVFGSNVTLDDTPVGIGTDPEFSNGLDNLGSGVAGADSPSAGIFFNDNTDGDIRGRTENFFADPLGNLLSTIGGGSFQFSLLDDTQLNLVVTAIEKSADATEVMSPILTVFNTERAYVSVINEVSFLQDFDVDVANTAFIANPEIGILQEGVVLDVQPTISYDRKYITLEVRTTVATIDRPSPTFETTLAGFTDAVTFQLPTLEVQNAATTVRVPDGGSVILGGLNSIRHINRRAEVPWISEIPLLGFFFREKGVVDEVSSLVILMRAQIRDLSPYREALPLR